MTRRPLSPSPRKKRAPAPKAAPDAKSARPATVVDVAEAAGVAIGTVSRYINGHAVRTANRDRIERAVGALGYRRNAVASAMRTDVTHIVGLMVPALSEFHASLLEQLSRHIRRTGRAVVSYSHDLDPRSIVEGLDFFASHRVDALVIDGGSVPRERLLAFAESVPNLVFYDNDVEGVPADRVFVKNRQTSDRAVSHLIELGHERIAMIAGSLHNSAGSLAPRRILRRAGAPWPAGGPAADRRGALARSSRLYCGARTVFAGAAADGGLQRQLQHDDRVLVLDARA